MFESVVVENSLDVFESVAADENNPAVFESVAVENIPAVFEAVVVENNLVVFENNPAVFEAVAVGVENSYAVLEAVVVENNPDVLEDVAVEVAGVVPKERHSSQTVAQPADRHGCFDLRQWEEEQVERMEVEVEELTSMPNSISQSCLVPLWC